MDILNELRNDYLSNRNIAIGSILIIILSYFGYQFVKNRPQNIEITEKDNFELFFLLFLFRE